ncbi:peptidylprolyl isomerase [Candidatus Pelagibacter sp.]|nr:peptidylprolyl isomerase [Candidatus Pelagibacter sp.]
MKTCIIKKNIINFFNSTFFLFLIILSISTKCEALENKIIFKVNNEIITSIDLLNNLNYLKSLNPNFENLDKNTMMSIASNELIKHKIKEIAIEQITNQLIDKKLLEDFLVSNYAMNNIKNISELDKYLNQYNIEVEYLKSKMKTNLLWNRLIFSKFSDKVVINKDEIKNELNKNNAQNEYNLSEIIFSLENNETLGQKSKKIFDIIEKDGFDTAALKFSNSDSSSLGGNIGWIKENSLNKNVRNSLKKVQEKNYTKPIVIPGGFLILKINELRTIELFNNIEEAVEETIKIKTNEQLNQFSNIYLNKFRKDVKIEKL